MAEPIRPDATSLFGKSNWLFVPGGCANPAAPTATELAAASTLDMTRIVFASSGSPTATTNRVRAERRLGDTDSFEFIGETQWTGGDFLYAVADQAAAGDDGKKMYETIPAGTTGDLIRRRGVDRATAPTAGQFVHVYPAEFGPSIPVDQGEGEAAEAAMTVGVAVTGPPNIMVAVVAGV